MIHNDHHGQKVRLTMDTQTKTKTAVDFKNLFITAGSTPLQLAENSLSGTTGFTAKGKPKNLEAWAKLIDAMQDEIAEICNAKQELKRDLESGEYTHVHINVDGDSQSIKRLYDRIILNKSLTKAQTLKALKNS